MTGDIWEKIIQLPRTWGTHVLTPSRDPFHISPEVTFTQNHFKPGQEEPHYLHCTFKGSTQAPLWPHSSPQGSETVEPRGHDPQSPQPRADKV